ncbi:hypothetical protein AAY473_004847 [Plecturocebus cupreus]
MEKHRESMQGLETRFRKDENQKVLVTEAIAQLHLGAIPSTIELQPLKLRSHAYLSEEGSVRRSLPPLSEEVPLQGWPQGPGSQQLQNNGNLKDGRTEEKDNPIRSHVIEESIRPGALAHDCNPSSLGSRGTNNHEIVNLICQFSNKN